MNARVMLADFLEIATPNSFHKHLLDSLLASLQSLLTNGQCTVAAIGCGIGTDAQARHCIKRADRLLSHTTMQQAVPEFYSAMTGALVKGIQPLILVDWSNADKERLRRRSLSALLQSTKISGCIPLTKAPVIAL